MCSQHLNTVLKFHAHRRWTESIVSLGTTLQQKCREKLCWWECLSSTSSGFNQTFKSDRRSILISILVWSSNALWNNPPETSHLLCLVLTAKSKQDYFQIKINWKTHSSRALVFSCSADGSIQNTGVFQLTSVLTKHSYKNKAFKPLRTLIIFEMLYMKKKLTCQSPVLWFYGSFLCLPQRFILVLV